VSAITLAEVGYVLTRVYMVDQQQAVDALIDLLNRDNIKTHEIATERANQALQL
jgi:hypothetical protein